MENCKPGTKVRDTISGLEGIVIARTTWLYGCVRLGVQPEGFKDGKVYEIHWVDEPQCEPVPESGVTDEPKPRAGPRADPQPRANPTR